MPDLFHALGDPTRRALLDRLRRDGALSLTELARPLPMSRQAVTKHLDTLGAAGLVSTRTEGRERVHELDAGPLSEVRDWLAPYEAVWLGTEASGDSWRTSTGSERHGQDRRTI